LALQAIICVSAGRHIPAVQIDASGSAGRQLLTAGGLNPTLQLDNFRSRIFQQHRNVSSKTSSPSIYYCEISGSNDYGYEDYVSVSLIKTHQVLER